MAISTTNALAPTTPGATNSTASLSSLSKNYTMFLQMLTTQMKNQSPLDPMDANQFTQQLVQYSSVEQLIKMNSNFEKMMSTQQAASLASLVNYVGTTVTVDGSTKDVTASGIDWAIDAPQSGQADISIKDSAGKVVFKTQQNLTAGTNPFKWDGRDSSGAQFRTGAFTVEINARSSSGAKIPATVDITGRVDKLEWADGAPYLLIGGLRYATGSVKSVGA